METNKVIEQVLDLCYKSLQWEWESGEISGWDQIKLELELQKLFESKATEVAKAICPKYQQLEDRNAKLLEALKAFKNKAEKDYPVLCESGFYKEYEQAKKPIQQSETKSKDNE